MARKERKVKVGGPVVRINLYVYKDRSETYITNFPPTFNPRFNRLEVSDDTRSYSKELCDDAAQEVFGITNLNEGEVVEIKLNVVEARAYRHIVRHSKSTPRKIYLQHPGETPETKEG